MTRSQIYKLIEKESHKSKLGYAYDIIMILAIILSLVPLTVRHHYPIFDIIEIFTTLLFILDYALRWITAPIKLPKYGWKAYLYYPLTPFAIIDLLSILPGIGLLNKSFKLMRITRLLRMFRVLKMIRYSTKIQILFNVLKQQRKVLLAVFVLAFCYIILSALIMFNFDSPENFPTFYDAIYWATTALTTVGYGDIYPVSNIGRLISMLSSIFGVAIIALPSGIMTAGYLKELEREHADQEDED